MFLPEPQFDEGIIVDRPNLVTKTRRFTELTISVASWILWFLAMRPVMLLLMWLAGWRFFYVHMLGKGGIRNPVYFGVGLMCIFGILALIIIWNRYDKFRYGGKYKGRSKGLAEDAYMAAFYRMRPEDVRRIKRAQRLDVYFTDNHQIELDVDRKGEDAHDRITGFYDPQNVEAHFAELRKLRP